MNLSNGEKLILVMLSEIYKKLDVKGEVNPDLVLTSIFSDHTWGLRWEYGSLFNDDAGVNPPEVDETCDILTMYRFIEASFKDLSSTDQARVRKEADPFSEYLAFQGFDGNHDPHVSVVHYLVDRLGRYDELKGKNFNSHSSGTLPHYRKMHEIFESEHDSHKRLSADQLIRILRGGR